MNRKLQRKIIIKPSECVAFLQVAIFPRHRFVFPSSLRVYTFLLPTSPQTKAHQTWLQLEYIVNLTKTYLVKKKKKALKLSRIHCNCYKTLICRSDKNQEMGKEIWREGRGKKFCLSWKEVNNPKLINHEVGCKKDTSFSLCASCTACVPRLGGGAAQHSASIPGNPRDQTQPPSTSGLWAQSLTSHRLQALPFLRFSSESNSNQKCVQVQA